MAKWLVKLAAMLATLLAVSILAPAAASADTHAFVLSDGSLVGFDPDEPGATEAPIPITGVTAGDSLVGIDFRPQNGYLYALGFNSAAGTVQIYALSQRTGEATALGAPASFIQSNGSTAEPVKGPDFGFDFDPTTDRIRVVTDSGQNFRLNPNTGAPVDGNPGIAGIQMDGGISGGTTSVDAAAHTNDEQNAVVKTIYTLDSQSNGMFIQNPPNNGTQTAGVTVTENGSPLDFVAANGFDIPPGVNVAVANEPATGTGFAALSVGGVSRLYRIDLKTGAATSAGTIGAGNLPIQGLAIQGEQIPGGQPAIGISNFGEAFDRFNTAAFSKKSIISASGFADTPIGIDWRPQTGQLFTLGVNAGANTATLYLVDPQTGVATVVGSAGIISFVDEGGKAIDLPEPSAGYGFDFNPALDRVRVVTNTGLSFRVSPSTGAPVDGNVSAPGIQPDGQINNLPPGSTGAVGAAFTNSYGQPITGGPTTLYVLDPNANQILIQNPQNSGTLTMGKQVTLNGALLDLPPETGFDIPPAVAVSSANAPATGPAYALAHTVGDTALYRIELSTGAADFLGNTEFPLIGVAVGDGPPPEAPPPEAPPSAGSPPAPLAFGAKTLVTLKLAKKKIGAGEPVPVLISNQNGFPVDGRLSAKEATKSKPIDVAADGRQTIKLKLSKSALKHLKHDEKVPLHLTAALSDPSGGSRKVSATLTPKLSKKRKG